MYVCMYRYAPVASRVPLIQYIKQACDDSESSHHFLTAVFSRFSYRTVSPGDNLVQFSDPADRLFIIVEGRVNCQFEHSSRSFSPMDLKKGDWIGDYAILGDPDWGNSSCFDFETSNSDEVVELQASAHPLSFVIVLELTQQDFHEALDEACLEVRDSVKTFVEQWRTSQSLLDLDGYGRKRLLSWDLVVRKYLRQMRSAGVLKDSQEFKLREWKVPSFKNSKFSLESSW